VGEHRDDVREDNEASAEDAVRVVTGPPGAAKHLTEAFLQQLEELEVSDEVLETLRKDVRA
jgi:hypothetical protein